MAKAPWMRSSTRRGLGLAAALCCAASLAAADGPQLRVGLIAPFSGREPELGAACRAAALLAVAEANSDGGLLVAGRRLPVVLLMKDTQGRPELAMSAAQELINQERADAIIGPPTSDSAIPVAKLADRMRIPMITQTATSPEVTRGTTCVFRVCAAEDIQGATLARFAWKQLKAKAAAVLFDVASAYPRGVAGSFAQEFRRLGGRVFSEPYTTGLTDWSAQMQRIKAARADVLLLPNYRMDLRRQLAQMRALSVGATPLGTETMSFRIDEDLAETGAVYFATNFDPGASSELARRFVASFTTAYKRAPVSGSEPLTYDAMQLLFEAVRRAGSTSAEQICAALRGIGRFEGVTGIMDFTGTPDPKKSVTIVRVQGGKLTFPAPAE
jgi:branched-chain amino acid transport system substrate-binding protein